MAVKGKHRKTSRNRRTKKRHTTRRQRRYNIRKACMLGGNYEKDVTTQTFQGFPMKESNKVVTTVPGRGVMSVSSYKRLMEDLDTSGDHFYD